MIARWQENEVLSSLKNFRVVNLTGARQCGKTTLSNMLSLPQTRRFALDNDETRKAAANDPYGFVYRRGNETFIIDEIQKVPELLNAIKMRVDNDNAKGQYLLKPPFRQGCVRFVGGAYRPRAIADLVAWRAARRQWGFPRQSVQEGFPRCHSRL